MTGLEGAEELWERLRESAEEVERLNAHSATLAAEVDGLRKRLRTAGELSDDELAAELPVRMSRNLAAAQDVADDMIDRARNDAMITRLNADQTAAQLLADAEAEATRIVQATVAKCRSQVEGARERANEMLRAAHAHQSRVLAELDERSLRIEREGQRLYDYRNHLGEAYEQVERALADARGALSAGDAPPVPREVAASERPPEARVAADRPAPEEDRRATGRASGNGDGGRRAAGVFDWSRAARSARTSDRPTQSTPDPAVDDTPHAGADAAAG